MQSGECRRRLDLLKKKYIRVFYPKRDADLQAAADAALRQILDKKYADVLRGKGVPEEKIRIYGFAFQGKQVLVDGGYISEQYGKGDTNERSK